MSVLFTLQSAVNINITDLIICFQKSGISRYLATCRDEHSLETFLNEFQTFVVNDTTFRSRRAERLNLGANSGKSTKTDVPSKGQEKTKDLDKDKTKSTPSFKTSKGEKHAKSGDEIVARMSSSNKPYSEAVKEGCDIAGDKTPRPKRKSVSAKRVDKNKEKDKIKISERGKDQEKKRNRDRLSIESSVQTGKDQKLAKTQTQKSSNISPANSKPPPI
ncbi:Hypothetical predicted protein [Mytilus galloprovincialis]|uniref:Uncharacterized protein n=1 Tax=Mytilus galloprovincialis TaxID=29158 RepID=A0A8B6G8W3_MYTGA|nr:Hypothetical predicted protein [Mytilus galloprovincialis]